MDIFLGGPIRALLLGAEGQIGLALTWLALLLNCSLIGGGSNFRTDCDWGDLIWTWIGDEFFGAKAERILFLGANLRGAFGAGGMISTVFSVHLIWFSKSTIKNCCELEIELGLHILTQAIASSGLNLNLRISKHEQKRPLSIS